MPPKLYMHEVSPPSRAVLITAAALGLDLELHVVDLMKGEHKTPEYLKINPQHTIPTLVDGDYCLWDSHAIIPYLVDKYGKEDSLYPKDLQRRGTIDQRLHYNNAVVFNTIRRIGSIFRSGQEIPEETQKEIREIYDLLNTFLQKSEFVAGDKLSIADFALYATVTSADLVVAIDETSFPNLASWLKSLQEISCCAVNETGLRMLEAWLKSNKTEK